MTATSRPTVEIHLVLNEQEAKCLMGIVQNPLSAQESPEDSDFRHKLFATLNARLVPAGRPASNLFDPTEELPPPGPLLPPPAPRRFP